MKQLILFVTLTLILVLATKSSATENGATSNPINFVIDTGFGAHGPAIGEVATIRVTPRITDIPRQIIIKKGSFRKEINLYNDGTHGDNNQNDNEYTGTWYTGVNDGEGDYTIDIITNHGTFENVKQLFLEEPYIRIGMSAYVVNGTTTPITVEIQPNTLRPDLLIIHNVANRLQLKLYDDGTHGDEQPNDNKFTTTWHVSNFAAGTYSIDIIDQNLGVHKESARGEISTDTYSSRGCISLEPSHNNPNEERINIVFVGVNYDKNQTNKILDFAKKIIDLQGKNNGILSVEPYKSNAKAFNFWAVTTIPRVDNYSEGWDQRAFEANMQTADATDVCPFENKRVIALTNWYFRSNANKGSIARISAKIEDIRTPNAQNSIIRTIVHEIGHSIGELDDEYTEDSNLTQETYQCYTANNYNACISSAPWLPFIGDGCGEDGAVDCQPPTNRYQIQSPLTNPLRNIEVTCYRGTCHNTEQFRPMRNTIMRMQWVAPYTYGITNEMAICRILRWKLGTIGGICNARCMDCRVGQKCLGGQCV